MRSCVDGRRAVIHRLRIVDNLLVALSGGVDSAVLLALAARALGPERVLAVTAVSDSLASHDLVDARNVARYLELEHEIVHTRELAQPGYRANSGDRCFHCRDELFTVLGDLARERGFTAIAYGAIADDVGDHRPGMQAAERHGVLAPLLEAGLNKEGVRALARDLGLPVADKPAAACLASRIPTGTEVTTERLGQVAVAETALRLFGFAQFRVRHHGAVARLELDRDGMARLADPNLRERVSRAVREAGFRYVALDIDGYRSGSLNPVRATSPRTGPTRDGGQ